jgi:hypothetical protein
MPSYDDDWELTDFTWDDSDDERDDDNESYYSDVEEQYNITDSDSKDIFKPIPQPVWKNVTIGGVQYMVSDQGCVKKPCTLFEVHFGLEEPGTPFKKITFPRLDLNRGEPLTYYMHDLVWQTFNGPPPPGWEVRHTANETSKHKRYYSNALRHLTIMPAHVTLRPKIFA